MKITSLSASVGAMTVAVVMSSTVLADPVNIPPQPDPIPKVFCIRITDVERVAIVDGTPDNDFAFEFEILNWTGTAASGFNVASTVGSTSVIGTNPTIFGVGVDQDGRGGPLGGADIDATGAGLTIGAGIFDPVPIQSGRGEGATPLLNDWTPAAFNATSARWGENVFGQPAGTPMPPQDLIAAGAVGGQIPNDLIPSQTPPFTPGDVDFIGDSAVDGGPATTVMDDPVPDGTANVLDGLTVTVQDWDVGERLSLNWFLVNAAGAAIGTSGFGNQFGFGTLNLVRMPVGGILPGPVFQGNAGFNQGPDTFFDTVFQVPDPAEFAVEMSAGTTADFTNPSDNIFNAETNLNLIPEPATLTLALIAVTAFSWRWRAN